MIETTTSDGQAKIYDYEDVAVAGTISAGTADVATTNAFILGTLTEIRKTDATWDPGSGAAPSGFVDKVKGGTDLVFKTGEAFTKVTASAGKVQELVAELLCLTAWLIMLQFLKDKIIWKLLNTTFQN